MQNIMNFLNSWAPVRFVKQHSDLYSYVHYIYPPIICDVEGSEIHLLPVYFSYFCISSSPLTSLPLLQHRSTY